MKIICDNCGAKYSIADEKVRGKVFKIRCKKCSEIIVVRGTVGAEAEADVGTGQAAAADYSGYDAATAAIWHVVIDGDQQGPYTSTQVADFVAAGQLDYDAYCWRDGFSDWVNLRDINELLQVVQEVAGGQSSAYQQDQDPGYDGAAMGGMDEAGASAYGHGAGSEAMGYDQGAADAAAYGQQDMGAEAYGQPAAEAEGYGYQGADAGAYGQQGMDAGAYGQPEADAGAYGQQAEGGSGGYTYQGADAGAYGQQQGMDAGAYGGQAHDAGGYGQPTGAGAAGYGFTAPASATPDTAQGAMADLFGSGQQGVAGTPGYMGAEAGSSGLGAGFAAPSASEQAARGTGHDAGADLFADAEEGGGMFPSAGGADVMTSSPRVDVARMTGTRNENSVLFSLSNLQALASGGAAPARPGPVMAAPMVGPSTSGTTEGSGLIDIKAMASAIDSSDADDGVDDLLAIGGGGGFAPTLGAPVLVAPPKEKSSALLIAVIGIGSALLLGVVALVVVLLWARTPEPIPVAAHQPVLAQPGVPIPGDPTTAVAAPATPVPPLPGTPTPAPEAAEGGGEASSTEGVAADTGDPEGAADEESGRDRRRSSKRAGASKSGSDSERGGSDPLVASAPAPAPAKAERPSPARGASKNDLDSLLDLAINPGAPAKRPTKAETPAAPAGSAGGGENLPQKLDRGAVRAGMNRVAGRVANCGNGQSGRVTVDVVISGSSGRVSDVTISGQFAGTPVGSCAARAVKGARFPRFRDPSLTVRGYPFPVH